MQISVFYKIQTGLPLKGGLSRYREAINHSVSCVLCDMIVLVSDVNTRNTNSLNVYLHKPNVEC